MLDFLRRHRLQKQLRQFIGSVQLVRHRDDDLLSGVQKEQLDGLLAEAVALKSEARMDMVQEFMTQAPARFAEYCPPPSFRWIREYLDVFAVVLVCAFGIRALIFQPFQIPTGSMQPTLFGIHYIDRSEKVNSFLGWSPITDLVLFAAREASATVENSGSLNPQSVQEESFFGLSETTFQIGNDLYRLPGTSRKVRDYAHLSRLGRFKKGEVLADGYLSQGDHLFVDRLGIHLFGVKRGDVVVFNTEGIMAGNNQKLSDISGMYYIKRLVGLPGDTLKVSEGILYIKPAGAGEFRPAAEFSEKLAKVYSYQGGYFGHSNAPLGVESSYLRRDGEEFTVPEDSFFMLGDNTLFSFDSRGWGVVPRRNIVGKAFFVFWPFSRRWGLADSVSPLDVPSGKPGRNGFKVMEMQ